jgi:hypothetical protein
MDRWVLAAFVFCALLLLETSGGERQVPAVENGKPVVRCVFQGRITRIVYADYACARAGGGWVPVPVE